MASIQVQTQMARNSVRRVLTSQTIGYINFTFSKWTFNAASYARVAHAVTVGNIPVAVGQVPPGAGASYNVNSDILTFPPNSDVGATVYGQAKIVHECTHAFIDMENRRNSKDSASEGAAYIAELMYMLYLLDSVSDPIKPFAVIAIKIAASLVNNRGGVVSLKDEMELRTAIAADPDYIRLQHMTLDSPMNANGLRRNNP